jgi:hypothetical protein
MASSSARTPRITRSQSTSGLLTRVMASKDCGREEANRVNNQGGANVNDVARGGVEGEQLTGARTVAIFSFRATSWISYVSLA